MAMAAYDEFGAIQEDVEAKLGPASATETLAINEAIKKAPFLTSTEADKLIEGLRGEKFFDKMRWDGQGQRWVSVKAQI